MVRAVLFDLDGTLLDTIGDLADAVNQALSSMGFQKRSEDEVRRFVGNGVAKLIERALPSGRQDAHGECMRRFKEMYARAMDVRTKPYPGIMELLRELKRRGILVAVVSNKFDGAVRVLCEKYFGELVLVSIGEKEGVPRKPAPDGCFEAMSVLGAEEGRVVYVGDADTDVHTAHNASMKCIGVTWGLRGYEVLKEAGADVIVSDAEGLLEAILGEIMGN